MHKVILTGGIASGKSEAAKIFQELGVPFIDSDSLVHELFKLNTVTYSKIVAHFGTKFVLPSQEIDRKMLGSYVFSHSTEKKWLENLLHPIVLSEIQKKIKALEEHLPKPAYCIIDIPLYAEIVLSEHHPLRQEFKKLADSVLVIDLEESEQKKRLLERYKKKNTSIKEHEIKAILAAQTTREERNLIADNIILNDKSLTYLKNSILDFHNKHISNYNIGQ